MLTRTSRGAGRRRRKRGTVKFLTPSRQGERELYVAVTPSPPHCSANE